MSNFRVTIQPGILRDPNGVLTIRFFAPQQADQVTLTLVEMDSWQYHRDTMAEQQDRQNDPIAVFTGSISRRQFQVQEHRPERAGANAPVLKVKFHGNNTEYRLPIPDSDLQEEGGELEVGLEVRGQIRAGRRVRDAEYRTPSPVFVRNSGQAGARQRPYITFITGRDGFSTAARRYWQLRSDGIVGRTTIEGILTYLGNQANLARAGEGRWGEVNIASHANTNQLMLKPFEGRGQQPGHIDVNVLNELGNDPRLVAPGANILDNNSRIVLRGCAIGNNQTLLDRIRQLFGGRAFVYAPVYLQRYEWWQRGRERTQRELFTEFLFFYIPGNRSPNEQTIIDRFRQLYARRNFPVDQWREMVRGRGEARRHDRTERFRFTLAWGAGVPPRAREDLIAELRRQWTNDERSYFTDVDDWEWAVRRQRGRGGYRVVYTGSRRRVEIRQLLRDTQGAVVVPNLSERTHYGRSPAW